jgi:single-stranded-DNA-specific exonuclease
VAVLNDCAHLLAGYGGHAGAAGFSIEPERIPELRSALSRAVAARSEAVPEPTVSVDAYVELPDLTLDLVAELNRLAPFGMGNPALTLAVRDLRVLSEVTIGRTEEHRRVTVEDAQDRTQTVFWWHGAGWPLPEGRFDLALALRASDYRGVPEVQVQWIDARLLAGEPVQTPAPARAIEVRDYREEIDPRSVLDALLAEGDLQVWAEGRRPQGIAARSRQQLEPGRRLAVWTAPPGPRQLQAALDCVQPGEVVLFALDPGLDEPDAFLTRLAGLAKYALRAREGWVDLEAAAAATSQRQATICEGLEWLAVMGQIRIAERGAARWRLDRDLGDAGGDVADAERARSVNAQNARPQNARAHTRLDALLAEAAAYRAYCRTAPPDALIAGS